MSETMEHVDDVQETDVQEGAEQATETRQESIEDKARRMGWKPASELRVQPKGGALSPEEFLKRGEEELPIMRERYRHIEKQNLELQGKVDQATTLLSNMTERMRQAEERAYKRAKTELEAKREAAIEAADVRTVRKLEEEIRDLGPEPEKETRTVQQRASDINADAAAWLADGNDWFTQHPDLAQEAQALHMAYQRTHPHLSVRANLDKVSDTIRRLHSDRFDNPRRTAPATVSSSTPAASRQKVDPKSFDSLPTDAKREFERYQKSLAGKGKPLTKDEWAKYYHDDGE